MANRFADLHCHPHMRSYNWLHRHGTPESNSLYNPWWVIFSDKRAQLRGKRAAAYSQCDMAKVINGNLRLAFLSLYPLEKGWVTGRDYKQTDNLNEVKEVLKKSRLLSLLSMVVVKLLSFIGDDKKGRLAIRDFIQAVYMKIPLFRINFVQSSDYDYFHEMLEEKKFLDKGNNSGQRTTQLFIPINKKPFVRKKTVLKEGEKELVATGEYIIAKNSRHVREIIDNDKTAFVLTIEGANVFNTKDDILKIKEKIRDVKNWAEPVFFITLTHHFYNELAGHAHSIPDIGNLLLDQSDGFKDGFTKKGIEITRYLLSIDEGGNYKPDEFERRILIDVKHLNARSRKEYYDRFIKPSLTTPNPIPVIASHVAFSGKSSLDDLIYSMDHDEEKDNSVSVRNGHNFNNWNINLCDEDIIMICKSKGLIGINLDQRVLGVSKKDIKNTDTHGNYVWQNIRAMMKVVLDSPEIDQKEDIVDLFSLGTDSDGFIDPLNKYPTVLQFEELRKDLIELVEKDPEKIRLTGNLSAEDFVEKICFGNAKEFVLKNFA
jgi:microsomal dipeptidase-like Zn-dependent dipeptidase